MRGILLVVMFLAGCAAPQRQPPTWKDCVPYPHERYNVPACPDEWVGKWCSRICTVDDHGAPLCYIPRACLNTHKDAYDKRSARGEVIDHQPKPTMLIKFSAMGCQDHEACHIENPYDPMKCDREYPCVEDTAEFRAWEEH